MESKKITQLATEVAPLVDDLTFIGDPITGQLKKVTLNQIAYIFGAGAAWGTITGLLSNQTDLQAALNLKADDSAVVKLTGNQTINGIKTFNNIVLSGFPVVATALVYSKGGSINPLLLGSTKNMTYAETGSNNIVVEDELSKAKLIFDNSVQTYTFPAATGTIALTSNLTSYIPYTGATSDVNLGTYDIKLDNTYLEGDGSRSGSLIFKHYSSGGTSLTNHTSIYGFGEQDLYFNFGTSAGNKTFTFDVSGLSLTTARTYTMPNASGTLALTSNLSTYVPYTGATTNVDLGANTLTANIVEAKSLRAIVNGTASSPLILKTGTSGLSFASDAISLISSPTSANTLSIYFDVATVKRQVNFTANSLTATRTYTLPDASGTLALTSDLTSFITLTSLSATSPLAYNNTTGAFSIQVANTSQNGYLSSTDWNTFNGKQNALTNPVTGTGTSGYLPKFTGTSTIGNSLVFDNGTNVGINTITPIYKLDVNGTTRIAGVATFGNSINTQGTISTVDGFYSSLAGSNSVAAGAYLQLSTNAIIQANDSNGLDFWTLNGSWLQRMRLFTNGNFAIGTTTDASYKLDVNGTGRFSGALSGTSATFSGDIRSNGIYRDYQGEALIQTTTGAVTQIGTSGATTGRSLELLAGNAVRLTIASTGAATFSSSVTAGDFLRVNGDTIRIKNNSSNLSYLRVEENASAAAYTYLSMDGRSSGYFAFSTNDTERMRITSGGNVGIGTSTPFEGGNPAKLQVRTGTDKNIAIQTSAIDGTGIQLNTFNDAGSANIPMQLNASTLIFSTGTERMRINASGYIGIGFSGYSSVALAIKGVDTTSSNNAFICYDSTASTSLFTVRNDGQSSFGSKMTITSVGQLYVGTTTGDSAAQFRFQYVGSSSQNGLQIFDNSNTNGTTFAIFGINNGGNINIGSISRLGTTSSILYNTTSDYRLKEDFNDFDGLSIISKIKTYDYQWKADKSRMHGVIAHELQEVLSYAVVGEKDGEQMQGVDYSKLVPILVKSIQELQERIITLESKLK